MNKDRDNSVDVIKGIAILLVVLGHAIQFGTVNFDNNIIYKIIYSFHMPLFMFVSGYIASRTKIFNYKFVLRKFNTLVIPFIIWYLINYIVNSKYKELNIIEYMVILIKAPDKGLWFLWILFLCFCILTIFYRIMKVNKKLIIILLIVLNILGLKFNFIGLNLVAWYFPFFYIGFLVAGKKAILLRYSKALLILSILIYFFTMPFWHRTSGPLFLSNVNILFFDITIFRVIITFVYKYITAFSAIFILFYTVKSLGILKNSKLFQYLGKKTMDIYIIHLYFLTGIGIGVIKISTIFIFALISSIALSFIINKSRVLGPLLLGKPYKSSSA